MTTDCKSNGFLRIFYSVMVLASPFQAIGQDNVIPVIALDEAIEMTLKINSGILVSLQGLEGSRGELKSAKGEFDWNVTSEFFAEDREDPTTSSTVDQTTAEQPEPASPPYHSVGNVDPRRDQRRILPIAAARRD